MNALLKFNVVWAESWADGEAAGVMHDLGAGTAGELPGLVRDGLRDAARGGWGVGAVYVTDGLGRRAHSHAEHSMN